LQPDRLRWPGDTSSTPDVILSTRWRPPLASASSGTSTISQRSDTIRVWESAEAPVVPVPGALRCELRRDTGLPVSGLILCLRLRRDESPACSDDLSINQDHIKRALTVLSEVDKLSKGSAMVDKAYEALTRLKSRRSGGSDRRFSASTNAASASQAKSPPQRRSSSSQRPRGSTGSRDDALLQSLKVKSVPYHPDCNSLKGVVCDVRAGGLRGQ
jgi:hypothetical protein